MIRIMNNKKIEMEVLYKLKEELEQKVKKSEEDKRKEFHNRNLKVLSLTSKLISPYVLSFFLVSGLFKLFGGSYPFLVDEKVKYKVYSLEYKSNGCVNIQSLYNTNITKTKNYIIINTPWQFIDDYYYSLVRTYEIDNPSLELFWRVLAEDYKYITETFLTYKEEEIRENIEPLYSDYFWEANLTVCDKTDTLIYHESSLENAVITLSDLTFSLIYGIIKNRRLNYFYNLKSIIKLYNDFLDDSNNAKEELLDVNKRILSLTKRGNGKL